MCIFPSRASTPPPGCGPWTPVPTAAGSQSTPVWGGGGMVVGVVVWGVGWWDGGGCGGVGCGMVGCVWWCVVV